VSDIALYYPNMRVRDSTWLKAALLHWPKIARMVPSGEDRRLSVGTAEFFRAWPEDVARFSAQYDCLLDLSVAEVEKEVGEEFLEALGKDWSAVEDRYALRWLLGETPTYGYLANLGQSLEIGDPRLGWVHTHKGIWRIINPLIDHGLAAQDFDWVGMHPRLASLYLCALADRLAHRNKLAAVTDQPQVHGALNGWNVDTLARLILGDDAAAEGAMAPDDIAYSFTVLAIETVLPQGLDHIPFHKVLQLRERLAGRMYEYRRFLETQTGPFAEIASITDENVRNERLKILVESEIEPRVTDLEQSLRAAGFQPVKAILSMKTMAPPAVVAAVAPHVGIPSIVAAGATLAGCLVSAGLDTRQQANRELSESPAGYLLGLRRGLSPHRCAELVNSMFLRR